MSDYFKNPAINASSLKLILENPAKYQHGLTVERVESKCFKIGTAVHCAVLEPAEFYNRYFIMHNVDKRTKVGKEEYTACVQMAGDKIVLSEGEFEQIDAMSKSILNHPTASKLFSNGLAEHEIYTELDGIPAKAKLDWLRGNVIVDLKTTDDGSPRGFSQSVYKYGYALQAAWYTDCCRASGIEPKAFVFVAVEKTAPYLVGIYQLDDSALEFGRKQYREALRIYQECTESGNWYGYSNAIEQITLPSYLENVYE